MWKNGGFFGLFQSDLCLSLVFWCVCVVLFTSSFLLPLSSLQISCNTVNLVVCEKKVHVSVQTKQLGREGPDCIKN